MAQIESLALFPLSDVVLLPQVSAPLYIFEPRYRQMTRDALAGANQIGMVTVRPEHVDDMAGDPAVFEIGCLGQIAQAQERPDGTFQIMLLGTSRFRILEEPARPTEQLYRSARVELLAEREPQSDEERERLASRRSELLELLEQLMRRIDPTRDSGPAIATFARLESPRLVNALTQSIALQSIERQQLLECDSTTGRFEIMSDLLRFRLAQPFGHNPGSTSLPN